MVLKVSVYGSTILNFFGQKSKIKYLPRVLKTGVVRDFVEDFKKILNF
jgi:hypothetical protein